MPFSLDLLRPKTGAPFNGCSFFLRQRLSRPLRTTRRKQTQTAGHFAGICREYSHIRIVPQDPQYHTFILRRSKGTCGINQRSAGSQHGDCIFQNILLTFRTHFHIFRAPLTDSIFVFTEHTLAGTGRISHNQVKATGKSPAQFFRRMTHHDPVGQTHAFHILRQDLCTVRHDLVADQKAAATEQRCQLAGFSSWGSAQVQNAERPQFVLCRVSLTETSDHSTGLFCHSHGAGFLNIVKTRFVEGMLSGAQSPLRLRSSVVIKSALTPGNSFQRKRRDLLKVFHRGFQQIRP